MPEEIMMVNRSKSTFKKVLSILAPLTLLCTLLLTGLSYLIYKLTLTRSAQASLAKFKNRLNQLHKAKEKPGSILSEEFAAFIKTYSDWCTNASPDIWTLTSFDGLKLNARYYPCEGSHRWLLGVHGYFSSHEELYPAAKNAHDKGYHTLAVNLRAHSDSEGNDITMGWYDRLDVLKWIDKIIDIDPEASIVLYGISMGAATVMMVSGEKLPPNVKCIVEDCGYTSIMDEFTYQMPRMYNLPTFPILPLTALLCRLKLGFKLNEGSAINQVKKSGTPILFIHGDQDDFVPFSMVHELYEAASCPKDLYIVHGAGHANSYFIDKENYWPTIWRFVDQYI